MSFDNPYSNSRRGRGSNTYDSYTSEKTSNSDGVSRKRFREQEGYTPHENKDHRGNNNRGGSDYNYRGNDRYSNRERTGGSRRDGPGMSGTGVNNAPLGPGRRAGPATNQQYSSYPQDSYQQSYQQTYQQPYQQQQQPYEQQYQQQQYQQQQYQQPYQQSYQQPYHHSQQAQFSSQNYQQYSYSQESYNSQGQQGFKRGDRSRLDSFRSRKDYNSDRRDNYRRDRSDRNTRRDTPEIQEEEQLDEKEPVITDPVQLAERIAFYENKLEQMDDVVSLNEITGIDSKWGIKPKGFENVTSQRAKLSGLFPLPGHPRPIDFTKLEGIVKSGALAGNDILIETSKIDPCDSKSSRTVVVSGVDFDNVDYIKIADEINKMLSVIDLSQLKSEQNVESKLKTKDNKTMIIELANNVAATICVCMSGRKMIIDGQELSVTITRPSDYISQGYIIPEDKIEGNVPDNAYKVAYKVATEYEADQIKESLESIHKVQSFQLLQHRQTKESLGIAFANFELESYEPKEAILKVQDILLKSLEISDIFKDGSFACLVPNETSIQSSPCTTQSLQKFVKNLDISTTVTDEDSKIIKDVVRDNKTSRVVQVINAVTSKDLIDDKNYSFIVDDITNEVRNFGEVLTVKIPRPANEFTPGLNQFSQPGIGKIFIEFSNEKSALDAIMGLSGRFYNDRTVLCSYYDADDFHKTILLSK